MRAHRSLFDHPVRANEQGVRDLDAERFGRLEIDHHLEFGRLFDRDVRGLRAAEELGELTGGEIPNDLSKARSLPGKATLFRCFRPLIDGRQAQHRDPLHDDPAVGVEHRRRQDVERGGI